ncbi:MAG: Conserved putative secreted protein [Nocardia sp.]|uniref:DUF6294 family protein n=1 Tax=Nocardia sp. TaxID=1821 RepID=UPI002634246B|nr:DUF6294 family protein [Nocardia sp.]MCU1647473.1 Conserved putative secreted protein [Nocardia sp.]
MKSTFKTRTARRLLPLAAALLALGTLSATTSIESASAATGDWTQYNWDSDMHVGDCTMFGGAHWTLHSNGTAEFDGTVTSSSNNDAWLMWAELRDGNNAVLARINSGNPSDWGKFVENLPDKSRRYRWFATGTFDKNLYPLIDHMVLSKHC